MAELVRYIHLNPVRAKMVRRPDRYAFSSHRAYLGLTEPGLLDIDPVLRLFARNRKTAQNRFAKHVDLGLKLGHDPRLYETSGGILGSEEFVDAMIHRIGEFDTRAAARRRKSETSLPVFDPAALLIAVEAVCDVSRDRFRGAVKHSSLVFVKEVTIRAGRRLGATTTALSDLLGISAASISRRHDKALRRESTSPELSTMISKVSKHYSRIVKT